MGFRSLVVLVILFSILACGCASQSSDDSVSGTSTVYEPAPCEYDYYWFTTDVIGSREADTGFTYAVVEVYIKNKSTKELSTSMYYWDFIASGVEYSADIATYDDLITYHNVDVQRGGEFTNVYVFQVPSDTTSGRIVYSGIDSPTFRKITYFELEE